MAGWPVRNVSAQSKMVLVRDVMTSNPISVKSDDIVTKARSLIRKYGYRALPVLEHDKLVGIISRNEILKVTSTRTNVSVSGLMSTLLITTTPDENIIGVNKKIIRHHIRQLPVVDPKSTDRLVGIVSSMNILKAFLEIADIPLNGKIQDIMNKEFISCNPDDELSKVWHRMMEGSVSGFPVVENKKVVGIITRMDMLRHGSFRLSEDSGKGKKILVRKVMISPAIVTTPDERIEIVSKKMLHNKIIRLPVVDANKNIIGIVDIEDILLAYLK